MRPCASRWVKGDVGVGWAAVQAVSRAKARISGSLKRVTIVFLAEGGMTGKADRTPRTSALPSEAVLAGKLRPERVDPLDSRDHLVNQNFRQFGKCRVGILYDQIISPFGDRLSKRYSP